MIYWLKSFILKLLSLFQIRIKMTYLDSLKALHKRYVDALASNDKRTSSELRGVLVKLYGYVHRYNTAVNTGKDLEAANSKAAIESILTANGLTVTEDGFFKQIPVIVVSKPAIFIPTDSNGDLVYTDATFDVDVWLNGAIDTSNFTLSKTDGTGVTSSLTDNTVTISNLTEASYVDITATRTGYEDVTLRLPVLEHKDGVDGIDGVDGDDGVSVFAFPNNILVPTDSLGNNPDFTNAVSTMGVFVGASDDTVNWGFAVQSQTNVTSAIQNSNEVAISGLTADVGEVVVRASKSGFSDIDITISVRRFKAAQTTVDSSSTDQETIDVDSTSRLFVKHLERIHYTDDVYKNSVQGAGGLAFGDGAFAYGEGSIAGAYRHFEHGFVDGISPTTVGLSSSTVIIINDDPHGDVSEFFGSTGILVYYNVDGTGSTNGTPFYYYRIVDSSVYNSGFNRTEITITEAIPDTQDNVGNVAVLQLPGGPGQGGDTLALGINCRSGLRGSVAFGTDCEALSYGNFAIGSGCKADGRINNAYGVGASAMGSGCEALNQGAHAFGTSCVSSGENSLSANSSNQAISSNSFTHGNSGVSSHFGEKVHGGGLFSSVGDNQVSDLILKGQTTDGTITSIRLGDNNRISLVDNSVYGFEIRITAVQVSGSSGTVGDIWKQRYYGVVKHVGGSLSISSVQNDTLTNDAGASGWSAQATLVAPNFLEVTVTGEANKTIRWQADVHLNKISW